LALPCSDVTKTELHVLWDCSQCMALWLHVVGSQSRKLFFNSNLQWWINLNLKGEGEGIGISNWQAFWATAYHSLRKWRNKNFHEENHQRPMRPHMEIARYATNYDLAVKVDNIVTALPKSWWILNGDRLKEYELCLIQMERERITVYLIYSKTNTRPQNLFCS